MMRPPKMLLLLFVLMIGCQQMETNPMLIPYDHTDFEENLPLLERIKETPHGYFRYINVQFSQYVCKDFHDLVRLSPMLNLHGDAHLEQYAVTDLGRGLTDFDDSSTGPGIVDIMRFTVSLRLVCYQLGWQDRAESLVQHFLDAYLTALENPDLVNPEPEIARVIQEDFDFDRNKYFDWINSIMLEISQAEKDSLISAMQSYVTMSVMANPDINKDFYHIVDAGILKMGIGSALDQKYLVRISGPTFDPLDDVVLECKEVRNLEGIDCIETGQPQDPYRILLGQARIAYQPFLHLGYFRFKNKNFWVHSWVDNYHELSVDDSYHSPEELREVVYDIGVQLGKGHVKQISSPFDLHVRTEQMHLVSQYRDKIVNKSTQLAQYVIDAWKEYGKSIE